MNHPLQRGLLSRLAMLDEQITQSERNGSKPRTITRASSSDDRRRNGGAHSLASNRRTCTSDIGRREQFRCRVICARAREPRASVRPNVKKRGRTHIRPPLLIGSCAASSQLPKALTVQRRPEPYLQLWR
jgi:hypothetical protein